MRFWSAPAYKSEHDWIGIDGRAYESINSPDTFSIRQHKVTRRKLGDSQHNISEQRYRAGSIQDYGRLLWVIH